MKLSCLALLLLGACAHMQRSSECRDQISECLSHCDGAHGEGSSPGGGVVSSTPCEQSCESICR